MVEANEEDGPVDLTWKQLTAACKNIGFDLTCGGCAQLFFTGLPAHTHSCKGNFGKGERHRIAAWLDTYPWRGDGSLNLGDICQALRTNKLVPGPLAPHAHSEIFGSNDDEEVP